MGMWELIREKINLIDIEDDIIDAEVLDCLTEMNGLGSEKNVFIIGAT